MLKKAVQFMKDARDELWQVEWPSRREAIYLVLIVLGFSFLLSFYLGAFDLLFSYLLRTFVLGA